MVPAVSQPPRKCGRLVVARAACFNRFGPAVYSINTTEAVMSPKRVFIAALLITACALGSGPAQAALCTGNASVPISYSSGSILIRYQICATSSSFYWDSTVTYSNVSFDGSFQINGSMNMRLDFAGNNISSVVFSGGPLTFTVGAQPYTVTFDNLSFGFNSALQPVTTTGSLTVNGVVHPADTAYFRYLFR
jgi:hypothetical protein